MRLEIIEASYHRNGVGGEGFTAILFKDHDDKKSGVFIASLFEESGYCAVYSVSELSKGNIAFARGNSWRGDRFEAQLRPALKKYQEETGTGQVGPFSLIPADVLEAEVAKVMKRKGGRKS